MTQDEALKLALEALEEITRRNQSDHQAEIAEEAITAIKTALEAKDEPVAWINPKELLVMRGNAYAGAKDWRVNLGLEPQEGDVALYTIPPQRTRIELTDEERQRIRTAVLKEKST